MSVREESNWVVGSSAVLSALNELSYIQYSAIEINAGYLSDPDLPDSVQFNAGHVAVRGWPCWLRRCLGLDMCMCSHVTLPGDSSPSWVWA